MACHFYFFLWKQNLLRRCNVDQTSVHTDSNYFCILHTSLKVYIKINEKCIQFVTSITVFSTPRECLPPEWSNQQNTVASKHFMNTSNPYSCCMIRIHSNKHLITYIFDKTIFSANSCLHLFKPFFKYNSPNSTITLLHFR